MSMKESRSNHQNKQTSQTETKKRENKTKKFPEQTNKKNLTEYNSFIDTF